MWESQHFWISYKKLYNHLYNIKIYPFTQIYVYKISRYIFFPILHIIYNEVNIYIYIYIYIFYLYFFKNKKECLLIFLFFYFFIFLFFHFSLFLFSFIFKKSFSF
ncbi:hypothetical protein PFLG_03141 [Plasmodium falciparum RAJ116]|uniref:Uncharacterized protein n=1 Tax=Plasmodium falciparum RAJ116 TaxID=580058 RepID=A0A0L0D3A2_PLAFA|nr:hypothetical protein PFLG_03141 [Plasmodium falciparum RAJ116]